MTSRRIAVMRTGLSLGTVQGWTTCYDCGRRMANGEGALIYTTVKGQRWYVCLSCEGRKP